MFPSPNLPKTEKATLSPEENQKGIKNHQNIAKHLKAAAELHLEAAKHHETGNHGKAAECTILAQGQLHLAEEFQKEDIIHHTLNS